MIPTVYLAGAITQATDGQHGNEWRSFVQDTYTHVDWINPLDYEHPDQEYGTRPDSHVVERDEELISESDGLLVMTEMTYQWGTPQEQYFAHQIGILNVVIYDGDPADLSLWCRNHADAIVPNIEEGIEVLYKLITGDKYDDAVNFYSLLA